MAYFNSLTDFTGEFNITQSKYGDTDLTSIITVSEERILKDLLGEDLYLKLIADLSGGVPQTQKYIDLVNGKTYSVVNEDGITVNVDYQGIKRMLRYFAYCDILKYQDSKNSEVGQVVSNQNNSTRLSDKSNQLTVKIEPYYNKGTELYGFDIENYSNYLTNPIYGDIPITDFVDTRKRKYDYYKELVKGSCFNFLYKNKTDYSTWQFTVKDKIFLGGWL